MPLVALALLACAARPEALDLADRAYDPAPQVPAILRDVAMIDDDAAYTHPQVPGHRTTMDGRVAVRVQGGTDEIDGLSTNLSFYLFVPERVAAPIVLGPPGTEILADPEPFDVAFPPASDPEVYRLGHHAICDPTTEFPKPGERPNPYACGPDLAHDCYDITVISSTSPGFGAQLWGTPVTVEVAEPKTASAHLVDVTLGEPVAGAYLPLSSEWTEPAVTEDGRLLTGRYGKFPRAWTNPNTGETLVRPYDLAYSVLPADAAPCDVTKWTTFHPMSHAPFDPQMVGTYGLAAWPFRDTEGQPIPDGEDMGGTYPWVDRQGANLFMTGVPGRIAEQSEARWPRRCVTDGCDTYPENIDVDRGFMVAGLWTHGKLVHLDGLVNNVDWAVGVTPATHWWVDLYRDEAGAPVPVRFGSGRFIEHYRNVGPYPPGYTHNANILDSLQNLHRYDPAFVPVTPRDVVWVMSTGVATDEIAFDDLLDPNALIVSNMTASITQVYDADGASTAYPYHHNGQVRTVLGTGAVATSTLAADLDEDIHLQNGATSPLWEVPAYGRVAAGEARIEPVALGGVDGRGLWLSGDAAVTYALPAQDGVDDVNAYVGVYLDPRAADGELRELLTFPDGTGIAVDGSTLVVHDDGIVLYTVALPEDPPDAAWYHLGLRIAAGHGLVTLLHDGYAFDRIASPTPLFSLDGGDLVVGRATSAWTGFRGWVDDLVVLLHDVDPEVACNHAGGTLVAVDDAEDLPDLRARAAARPAWTHALVAAAAGVPDGSFACTADHRADRASNLHDLPAGATSVRDAVLFPEGPLQAGVPRPDTSENGFCLSCHHESGRGGLTLAALAADPATLAEDDLRRQPSQPPRRVFGNVPAGWIAPGSGPGSPEVALRAPPEGLLIDPWVLPAGR